MNKSYKVKQKTFEIKKLRMEDKCFSADEMKIVHLTVIIAVTFASALPFPQFSPKSPICTHDCVKRIKRVNQLPLA